RLHISGDFYSTEYIKKWCEIARRNKHITFLAFTRAWRVEELRKELLSLLKLKNFVLYLSTDMTTEKPPESFIKRGAFEAGIDKTYYKPAKECSKRYMCSECLHCFKRKGHIFFSTKD
ncbi:MAG: GP88 family protein, partial [Candidatus Methanospirareceae archaeon]